MSLALICCLLFKDLAVFFLSLCSDKIFSVNVISIKDQLAIASKQLIQIQLVNCSLIKFTGKFN